MRPTRLELAGFSVFRDPTVVDFDGADLFALVGPTGAGKSSLIDAMVFCLYGTVPRLDRRAVEPVIASGKVEARVRFDFTIGERAYTAARVVRRTKTGATTKEARLESHGQVLAGDADGVTKAVEDIVGLGFEQFTTCVVLPQGEFARFLHDKPRDRQQLLVRLLELGAYDRMRQAATARAGAAEGRAEVLDEQLAGLVDATPEALAAAQANAERLADLREDIDRLQPRLDELAHAEAAARQEATAAAGWDRTLATLAVPGDVADLAARAATAEQAAAQAESAREQAATAVDEAEKAVADLADSAALDALARAHERRGVLAARRDTGQPIVASARQAEEAAAGRHDAAEQALAAAEETLTARRRAHAAHDLAAHLRPGQPCPVCEHPVTALPSRTPPADLAAAEEAVAAARAARDEAAGVLRAAGQERVRAEETLAQVTAELAGVEAELDGRADADEVRRQREAVTAAQARLAAARQHEAIARATVRDAVASRDAARARRDGAWADFDAARDRVAELGPPPVDRADLAGAWTALVEWARGESTRRRAAAQRAVEGAEQAAAQARALTADLLARCADCDVEVAERRPRDAVTDALAAAIARRERIAGDLQRVADLQAERDEQRAKGTVARALAQHLAANRFEQWLLDEALHRLTAGAGDVLRELSGGQYSLVVDGQRNFAVVDHRNADERRSARTLSGGETFLASLALALTLADHLAAMATDTAPRLESIFLDEGFGSLDHDTLDVVAAAIEELGATGRTVGLVTHVRELAERVPVRYEVRPTPGGSTVQRVTP